ncbi:hypothetical protein GTQ99_02350 [Kineococcus sp. T13]|uniref:hypothetical protein n=1 Tax=Kineococcus vitellinus TaxID=2696565 RepID=UPI0014122BC6|nr:hypothetical protein [Kineococcus vitellinus]NAZ74271.1 hypothetical protein [Kineococcus vitellinus]
MDEYVALVDVDDRRLLQLIADGCSVAEAADALGWQLRYAGQRLQSLRRRLKVGSTAEVVALVIRWRRA